MKKGIIVLLITVLAAGMAFAGLTGSAAINLGYNLDTKDYGFENKTNGTYKFTFSFDKVVVDKSEHQTDIWAEVGAEASAVYSKEKKNVTSVDETDDVQAKLKFKVTKANIHINDITFGILNAGGAYNYAADYHLDDNGDPKTNKVFTNAKMAPGFTVSYDGYGAGFGFSGNSGSEKYEVLAHVQTKPFEFVEGLTAQAAAHAYVADNAKQFYFAAKTAYKADKLSAGAAGEIRINDSKFDVEAAANASYDFVYANLYFYTLAAERDADVKAHLDAKLGAGYTFGEDVEVSVNGYVDAVDVIKDAREITIGVDASATISQVSVSGEAAYGIYGKDLELEGKVAYTHDVFVASAKLEAELKIGADPALKHLKPELSVSTDKIVENAGLALTWKGADFAKGIEKKGAITASATIKF